MGLSFVVQAAHVAEGDLELRCTSTVTLSYWDDSREIVLSDAPLTEQMDSEGSHEKHILIHNVKIFPFFRDFFFL